MIKMLFLFVKYILFGCDLKADFNIAVSFEEALEYLNKGYFIYDMCDENNLYVKIRGEIYLINTKKCTGEKVHGFSTLAFDKMWKIVPERMQIEKKRRVDDEWK